MSGPLFVDASMFLAAANAREPLNARAKEILSDSERVLTTDHVLVETWFWMRRRAGRHAADTFWGRAREGGVRIEFTGPADLEVAWAIGESWPDQDFSLVDRTSFAVMQRLGIDRVATLDDHFGVFRFGPRRERAFELVR